MELAGTLQDPLDLFSEAIGNLAHYWGFKKVHGKMWATLYLSGEAIDSLELRKRLKISKALVSISLKDLIQYGMVRETGKSPRGTLLYEAVADVRAPVCNIIKNREQKMLEDLSAGYEAICQIPHNTKQELKLCPKRLENMGHAVKDVKVALAQLIGDAELDWMQLADCLKRWKLNS